MANRQEILDHFVQNFGLVPDFLDEMPDPVLEQYTNTHIDHRDDEAFFVLEGTYSCLLGDQTLECGPGESFFAPRGTPHAFKNVGDTQARHEYDRRERCSVANSGAPCPL